MSRVPARARGRVGAALIASLVVSAPLAAGAHQTSVHAEITRTALRHAAAYDEFNRDHGHHFATLRDLQAINVVTTQVLSLPAIDDKDERANFGLLHSEPSAELLLATGAIYEDAEPLFCNHFYDPNHPVHELNGSSVDWVACHWLGSGTIESSYAFMKSEKNPYNYAVAVSSFARSVISPTAAERERHLAMGFISLGGVLHLIEDASQPSHTRNDSHGYCGTEGETRRHLSSLECFELMDKGRAQVTRVLSRFNSSVRTALPPQSALAQMAIFSSRNYFSDQSLASSPQPRSRVRNGLVYNARGVPIAHELPVPGGGPGQTYRKLTRTDDDDVVTRAQLATLLPIAVGRSAQAINYFFRLRFTLDNCVARRSATGAEIVATLTNRSHAMMAGVPATSIADAGAWLVATEDADGRRTTWGPVRLESRPGVNRSGEQVVVSVPVLASVVPNIVAVYAVYNGTTADGELGLAEAESPVHLVLPPPAPRVIANNFRLGYGAPLNQPFDVQCSAGDTIELQYALNTEPNEMDHTFDLSVDPTAFVRHVNLGPSRTLTDRVSIGKDGNYRVWARVSSADDAEDWVALTVRVLPNPN